MMERSELTLIDATACGPDCACCAPDDALLSADPRLRRRAWLLTALTIGWNSVAGVTFEAHGLAITAVVGGLLATTASLLTVWLPYGKRGNP